MAFSKYLDSKRKECKELVEELSGSFSYVSILASDVKATTVMSNKNMSSITEGGNTERGFVIKMQKDGAFYEYSLSDISGDKRDIARKIEESLKTDDSLSSGRIICKAPDDAPFVKSFERESDTDKYTNKEILDFCVKIKDEILARDENILNAYVGIMPYTTSKLFITKTESLTSVILG